MDCEDFFGPLWYNHLGSQSLSGTAEWGDGFPGCRDLQGDWWRSKGDAFKRNGLFCRCTLFPVVLFIPTGMYRYFPLDLELVSDPEDHKWTSEGMVCIGAVHWAGIIE